MDLFAVVDSFVHALNAVGNYAANMSSVDGDYYKYGIHNIANGVQTFYVTFTTSFATANYRVNATLINVTDVGADHMTVMVTEKAVNRFQITLSEVTTSANYKIDWSARLL